jgi:DNA processing protein
MSGARGSVAATGGACVACLRRSWLLAQLSGPLECCARDRARLDEVLALGDDELLAALAGRRAAELRARYERFPVGGRCDAGALVCAPGVHSSCRHRRGYPRSLAGAPAPPMLYVAGRAARLAELAAAPTVSILGSRAASDYGLEIARSLARGLAASGVCVVAGLADGVALAAHMGALEASGRQVAVAGGGLSVSCPARMRACYERLLARGCAVSELPGDCDGRRWGGLASERILAALGQVAVLVEADDRPAELAAARIAQALGRALAAVPGRVSSPLSRGPHALLRHGASLVRGAGDVLELLYASAGPTHADAARGECRPAHPYAGLEPRLRTTLELVGAGCDTPGGLARAGADAGDALLALSELELMGLLARGDGGRYLPRDPLPVHAPSTHPDGGA